MNTTTILRQAENLASDEEKLMLLGDFIEENFGFDPVAFSLGGYHQADL